jgi:hypothetical protein
MVKEIEKVESAENGDSKKFYKGSKRVSIQQLQQYEGYSRLTYLYPNVAKMAGNERMV